MMKIMMILIMMIAAIAVIVAIAAIENAISDVCSTVVGWDGPGILFNFSSTRPVQVLHLSERPELPRLQRERRSDNNQYATTG